MKKEITFGEYLNEKQMRELDEGLFTSVDTFLPYEKIDLTTFKPESGRTFDYFMRFLNSVKLRKGSMSYEDFLNDEIENNPEDKKFWSKLPKWRQESIIDFVRILDKKY